ncbi:hypothetical protein D3C72_1071410 [compost metagenome]
MKTMMMFILTLLSVSVQANNFSATGIEKGYSGKEATEFAEALKQVRPFMTCTEIVTYGIPKANIVSDPYSTTPEKNLNNKSRNTIVGSPKFFRAISEARLTKETEVGNLFERCLYKKRDLAPALNDTRDIICVTLRFDDSLHAVAYKTQKAVRKNLGTLKSPRMATVWADSVNYRCN